MEVTAATDKKRQLRWLYLAIFSCLLPVGMAILYRYNPTEHSFYPRCLFRKFTGLNCPGCGCARAYHQLLHGHIAAAADYNIMAVVFLPVVLIGLYVQITGRSLAVWNKINKPLPVLIIICLFWILRNVDVFPLYWLNADK